MKATPHLGDASQLRVASPPRGTRDTERPAPRRRYPVVTSALGIALLSPQILRFVHAGTKDLLCSGGVTTKTIVCLASSRKHSGRCVAGIELVDNVPQGWVRPVSAREGREVSEREREYADGSDPDVLDIIDVPLVEARPEGFQTENWLLDPDYYWDKIGTATWDDLTHLEDRPETLWVNGESTYHGENDRVALDDAELLQDSLALIHVDRVRLEVHTPGASFGDAKRVVRAHFTYSGVNYALLVTDPWYEREYLARRDGNYDIGESYLTVSLGEPWNGYAYKLVAAIIERDG